MTPKPCQATVNAIEKKRGPVCANTSDPLEHNQSKQETGDMSQKRDYGDSTPQYKTNQSDNWRSVFEVIESDGMLSGYTDGLDAAAKFISEKLTSLNSMGVPHSAIMTVMTGCPDFSALERSLFALEETAWHFLEGGN